MKILLTGGSGHVGRNILAAAPKYNYTFFAPTSKELNLLESAAVKVYIANLKPDLIIHAAGKVGGIQANIENPVRFLIENLDIGKNLLLAAREAGVKKLMNLGSSCMYPRTAENPLKEELILRGELEPTNEGYALAKILVARLAEYLGREDKTLQYKTIIPCNLFGKWDNFDAKTSHMIPAAIRKVMTAKAQGLNEVEIWGDGTARREFMYTGNLVDFIFYAIENFDKMPAYLNVGPGTDYSINEYYEKISAVTGYKGGFKHDLTKPVGMRRKLVDTTKLSAFGWKPRITLEQGLKETCQFFQENHANQ
jgi:GDP-L-fucose synthase